MPLTELWTQLGARLGFRLYPMVSTDGNAQEAIHYGLHAEDLEALRDGAEHPQRARRLVELDVLLGGELDGARRGVAGLLALDAVA